MAGEELKLQHGVARCCKCFDWKLPKVLSVHWPKASPTWHPGWRPDGACVYIASLPHDTIQCAGK